MAKVYASNVLQAFEEFAEVVIIQAAFAQWPSVLITRLALVTEACGLSKPELYREWFMQSSI
ncbi:hypothetical protein FCU94_19430 [Vibrio sp. JPW-9-11-11]|uniref:hypothetical protein n=1 Tax=Vibrio sp. JPW-9-11-11 TaxID=1416532 RepID=UPI00159332A2|nr:hypothetical protein [Vibrio sp. JPW-9-11-11]NVD09024.1 hypothetical protein [Vibrio sp. JPW-9-11-11]